MGAQRIENVAYCCPGTASRRVDRNWRIEVSLTVPHIFLTGGRDGDARTKRHRLFLRNRQLLPKRRHPAEAKPH